MLGRAELVELVRRLRALEWSWRRADAEQVAADFGWQIEISKSHWIVLDIGFGADSGSISGDDGRVTEIDLRVTDYVSDDAAGRDRAREAFVDMVEALSAEFGPPTKRMPGVAPEVRWAGTATTTVLSDSTVAVHVRLVTNEHLAREDEIEELHKQGLL